MTRGLLSAAVCVVALSGCGTSSKPAVTAIPGTSSAVSFQSRVDAICVDADRRIYGSSYKSAEGTPLSKVAAGRARTADELARLKAPSSLSADYRRLIASMRREAALLHRLASHDNRELLATMRGLRSNPLAKQALKLNVTSCV
jgi:hypothetical protein